MSPQCEPKLSRCACGKIEAFTSSVIQSMTCSWPGKPRLVCQALAQIQLQDVDRIERVDARDHQPPQGVDLRVEHRRRGQRQRIGGVEDGLPGPNVAQGLVAGVVVEPIELGQIGVRRVAVGVVVIGAQDDLVKDAVDVEEVALHIRIKA